MESKSWYLVLGTLYLVFVLPFLPATSLGCFWVMPAPALGNWFCLFTPGGVVPPYPGLLHVTPLGSVYQSNFEQFTFKIG